MKRKGERTVRIRHGYTNAVHRIGEVVTKAYAGPEKVERQQREVDAVRTLAGQLPVPQIVSCEPGTLTTRFVEGIHAQELLEAGKGAQVLLTCGQLLCDLQGIRIEGVDPRRGIVLIHGDFGPNNLLMNDAATEVRLLCDWEWCGVGSRLTDLAWCECIIRMHHPDQVRDLSALFEGFGAKPPWLDRQAAMLDGATRHLRFIRRWPRPQLVAMWEQRLANIIAWRE